MKKEKRAREWHGSSSKFGMGDYYGTGLKAKVGRIRDGMNSPQVTPKELKTPPRTLA